MKDKLTRKRRCSYFGLQALVLSLLLASCFFSSPFWAPTTSWIQHGNVAAATTPTITLSPSSGAPFDQITVSGTGFTSGQTISVNLYFPGYSASISSDNDCATVATDGTFQCSFFRIPEVSVNSYTVVASDPVTESANATFTVTSAPFTFSVTPTSGAAGSSITITGGGTVGFYPSSSEQIYFGTSQIGTWTSTTGSFSVSATVPNLSPGTYAGYTQDSSNEYGFASFTINSGTTPPTTVQGQLSDSLSFSDQSSQSITQVIQKGLSDSLTFADTLSNSIGQLITKGLSDSVSFSDQFSKSITQIIQKRFLAELENTSGASEIL